MLGITSVVVSRTLRPQDHPEVAIIGKDLRSEVAAIRARDGKEIWLFGGPTLFGNLLDQGLVDLIEVAVIPIVLGGGIPLVPPRSRRASLRLLNTRVLCTTGTVCLEYAVIPMPP